MRAKYVSVQHASARDVAERWRNQYCKDERWTEQTAYNVPLDVYNQLCALGPAPDIHKVAEIIGNKSWSFLTCDGCGEYVETAVAIGTDNYEEPKKYCRTCVAEAWDVMK